jgi:hypothetical protein
VSAADVRLDLDEKEDPSTWRPHVAGAVAGQMPARPEVVAVGEERSAKR